MNQDQIWTQVNHFFFAVKPRLLLDAGEANTKTQSHMKSRRSPSPQTAAATVKVNAKGKM